MDEPAAAATAETCPPLAAWLVLLAVAPLLLLAVGLRARRLCRRYKTVAFFHPYCEAGGGGERVLWIALEELVRQVRGQPVELVIYSGSDEPGSAILEKARTRMGVHVDDGSVRFVHVSLRTLLEARLYPVFTMLGQSVGSVVLALECLFRHTPDVWVDSTGAAFAYPPVALLAGCRVVTYTHYPTITTDMLQAVAEARPSYNNGSRVARSRTLTGAKLAYYRLFAALYRACGWFVTVAMANGTWTATHLRKLWSVEPVTVFPPCGTAVLLEAGEGPAAAAARPPHVLSLGQFRPEKDHALQLHAFAKALDELRARKHPWASRVRLVLVGGARNAEDAARVKEYQALADELGVGAAVEWHVNVPFSTVKAQLGACAVGLHTMWNEHFGISVVEMQASGLLVVAHDSGGPRLDILVEHEGQATGMLAGDADGFASALCTLLEAHMGEGDGGAAALAMRRAGRAASARFSDAAFCAGFVGAMAPVLAEACGVRVGRVKDE